ncbi:MAG: hypothetical protein AAGD35_13110 [Actinomycetota bacterium]
MKSKLAVAVLAAFAAIVAVLPVAAQGEWSAKADRIWDVTDPDPNVAYMRPIRAIVWDIEQLGDRVYVGGRFLSVKSPRGETFSRPYLAAFDLESGAWIDGFQPQLDGAVYAIDTTADGRLVVGGEMTGGVVKLDPISGATVGGFTAGITKGGGKPGVTDIEVVGGDLYAGGSFSRAQGVWLGGLAKLDAATGAIDRTWTPTADLDTVAPRGAGRLVFGLAVDPSRDRVYVAGKFGSISGNTDAAYFATLDTTTGAPRTDVPQGLPAGVLYHSHYSMWQHDVQWAGDKVFIGGQAHQTVIMNADDLRAEQSFYTNRGVGDRYSGGDTQVIHVGRNTVWSGCHCWGSVGEYPIGHNIADPEGRMTLSEFYSFASEFGRTAPFGQQDVNGMYGVDLTTGQLVDVNFSVRGRAGAYAILEDTNGRVWFGGQFTGDPDGGHEIHGLFRSSPAPGVMGPTGLRSTMQTRERVVLTWDRYADAVSYEISADGVVIGTKTNRWFTHRDLPAGTGRRYTVTAILPDGSRSPASNPVEVSTRP